jgi:hypothetical protein
VLTHSEEFMLLSKAYNGMETFIRHTDQPKNIIKANFGFDKINLAENGYLIATKRSMEIIRRP